MRFYQTPTCHDYIFFNFQEIMSMKREREKFFLIVFSWDGMFYWKVLTFYYCFHRCHFWDALLCHSGKISLDRIIVNTDLHPVLKHICHCHGWIGDNRWDNKLIYRLCRILEYDDVFEDEVLPNPHIFGLRVHPITKFFYPMSKRRNTSCFNLTLI